MCMLSRMGNPLFIDISFLLLHSYFTTQLKGLQKKQVQSEIDRYIESLALEDKRHVPSKNLSGGMKRKLSVGIALIADSKVSKWNI